MYKTFSIALALLAAPFAFSEEAPAEMAQPAPIEIDTTKLSETLGHLMCKNLENFKDKIDFNQVIAGIKNAMEGAESPMTEQEFLQAMSQIQEEKFHAEEQKNLNDAEDFLSEKAKEDGMISLEEGKVLYRVDKQGKGEAVEDGATPLVIMKGTLLKGDVFADAKEGHPLPLDTNTMPGLLKTIPGMKVGEKRTIHLHPEFAYGNKSTYFPPNALVTFEVEVLEANAPIEDEEALTSKDGMDDEFGEFDDELIADDELEMEALR